jgi:hypothetical protein
MSEKLGNAYENKIKKPVTIDIYNVLTFQCKKYEVYETSKTKL